MIIWKRVEEKVTAALEQLRSISDLGQSISASSSVQITDCLGCWVGLEIRVKKLPGCSCLLGGVDFVTIWGWQDIAVHYQLTSYEEPVGEVILDTNWVAQYLQAWLQRHLQDLGDAVEPRISPDVLGDLRSELATALMEPSKA